MTAGRRLGLSDVPLPAGQSYGAPPGAQTGPGTFYGGAPGAQSSSAKKLTAQQQAAQNQQSLVNQWNTLTIPRGASQQFNQANWGQTGKSHS